MMTDNELQQWQAQWQQPSPDLTALLARAQGEDRRHRIATMAEYAAGVALLAASLAYAIYAADELTWLWAGTIWLLGAPALVFTAWNRRGLAGDAGIDAHQRLALSIRRCRRAIRAVYVNLALLFASTAVVVLFALRVAADTPDRSRLMLVLLGVLVAMYIVALGLWRWRLNRRLRALERLRNSLSDSTV